MKDLKERFATHNVALELFKNDYDEPCFGYYTSSDPDELIINNISKYELTKRNLGILAPTWDQVIEWLETKNIWITIHPPFEDLKFEWGAHKITSKGKIGKRLNEGFNYNSKQEALIAAIEYTLIFLI
jgi:hypothetical protein